MEQFRTGKVGANGIDFHYIEAGSGPLVLCLHGFPDNAYTYRYLLPVLAQAGFRAVAPFMRGYFPSGRPADERYESVLLARDAAALIAALGADQGCVIGHDWGGAATAGCAVLAPQRVHKIVTLAIPPRSLRHRLRLAQGRMARVLLPDAVCGIAGRAQRL